MADATFKNQNANYPKQTIAIEMTGRPEGFVVNTKKDFLNKINKNRRNMTFKHEKLAEARYLLTASKESQSAKMKYAAKRNIEILTYKEALIKFQIRIQYA